MKIQERPYREHRDLARMRQLVMDGAQASIPASYMHPGCLDWGTSLPPNEEANRRNLRLWERLDNGSATLAAWAIFLQNEGSFDLFVHPALYGAPIHETIMDDFVAWAETRAHEAGLEQLWPFWAMEHDEVLTRLMKERGYTVVQADPAPPFFGRSLDELPAIQLPGGYAVQSVTSPDDGQLRALVTHGAFGSGDNWDSYWETYTRFMGSTAYDGERDLFVRSPDGRGASACTIWFDSVNAVGLFEPVGTHPDFQGKGLGKAVMAEGLRRMKEAGMRRAVVGFDPNNAAARALYTSMEFTASSYFTIARKEL